MKKGEKINSKMLTKKGFPSSKAQKAENRKKCEKTYGFRLQVSQIGKN